MLRLPCCLLVAFTATLALAPATADAQRAPDMATLDRGDGISKVSLDIGYVALDGPLYEGAFRFEPHGQYVLSTGVGFYGALPVSLSFGDDDDPPRDQDDIALGGLELGLLYIVSSDVVSWVFRTGLVTPTADDSVDGALTNSAAQWPRFTDSARATPEAWYVRPGVSLLVHDRRLFLRGDLGFDLRLDDGGRDQLLRFNLGGGVDLGVVALSLELVNLADLDDDDDEELMHTLAVTVRFMTERFEPFVSVGKPLDDSAAADVFVAAGLQFPM